MTFGSLWGNFTEVHHISLASWTLWIKQTRRMETAQFFPSVLSLDAEWRIINILKTLQK